MSDENRRFRVEYEIHFKRDRRARKVVRQGPPPTPSPDPVPRIARLLALAWKWEGMVRRGEVKDYAEIARLSGLTRARVTQVLRIRLLAPDIQQQILLMPLAPCPRGIPEHVLRNLADEPLWRLQRTLVVLPQRRPRGSRRH